MWLLVSVVLLALASWYRDRRDRWSLLPLALLLGIAGAYQFKTVEAGTVNRWSPYYRIEVVEQRSDDGELNYHKLNVNRDVHQIMLDMSPAKGARIPPTGRWRQRWTDWKTQYDFSYLFKSSPESVLIGGAGSGNNAAAALLNGAGRVTAVEIDPQIIDLGRTMHPLRPYVSERVKVVNDDIRSYMRWSNERYDLIEYGILDSHTALSSLSSLRLDNYVYTVEGIRDAVRHLNPDGLMVLLSVWTVHRKIWTKLNPAYACLIVVLVGWYLFPLAALNALPFHWRALLGTLLVVLPLFFAGIVFARSFSQKKNTAAAFGSNLIGAVIGGAAEAASLAWGIRSLTIIALLFYLTSWVVLRRQSQTRGY